jgi:hypothetical protein
LGFGSGSGTARGNSTAASSSNPRARSAITPPPLCLYFLLMSYLVIAVKSAKSCNEAVTIRSLFVTRLITVPTVTLFG